MHLRQIGEEANRLLVCDDNIFNLFRETGDVICGELSNHFESKSRSAAFPELLNH